MMHNTDMCAFVVVCGCNMVCYSYTRQVCRKRRWIISVYQQMSGYSTSEYMCVCVCVCVCVDGGGREWGEKGGGGGGG